MKKVSIAIVGIILVAVVGIFVFTTAFGFGSCGLPWGNQPDVYDRHINTLTNTHKADLIIYGEDVVFRESMVYRKINSISDNNLKSDSKFEYRFIVIVDLKGNLNLSDDDYAILHDYVFVKKYNFYYYGESLLNEFKNKGFYEGELNSTSKAFSVTMKHKGIQTVSEGFWDDIAQDLYKTDSEVLPLDILDQMLMVINSNK